MERAPLATETLPSLSPGGARGAKRAATLRLRVGAAAGLCVLALAALGAKTLLTGGGVRGAGGEPGGAGPMPKKVGAGVLLW